MRISDWSSDVCSSDLNEPIVVVRSELGADTEQRRYERSLEHMAPMIVGAIRQPPHSAGIRSGEPAKCDRATAGKGQPIPREQPAILPRHALRPAERRVGKEWVSTCVSRWSPDH